ncbi:MAG TPA: hypothetical protein VIM64_15885, partial [Puia sp.]
MKKIVYLIVTSLIATCSFGQTAYEPQILVLSPGNVRVDKALEKEMIGADNETKKSFSNRSLNEQELQQEPANIQRMA